ncbi:trypsin-1-like [Schistocerca piceifrons]|uniref:trypsin-1-like n=1 Tax=Schistocerca piceifrons TaxID=274613 RepID=UPI001F5F8476|nr:trypsin-1-like [Schistocerca piceifrons]
MAVAIAAVVEEAAAAAAGESHENSNSCEKQDHSALPSMLRLCVVVLLASTACVLGASLPIGRLAHTGPVRRLGVAAGLIYGGHDAARGEFPYMVSLKIVGTFTKSHHCGGAIIFSTSVLTAAHCTTNIDKSIVSTRGAFHSHHECTTAVAGELDQSTDEGTEQEVRISQMIKHPDHPGGTDVSPNDIAVIKLMTAFTFNSFVQPINLPSAGVVPTDGSSAAALGWGEIEDEGEPDILQTVDVVIIDQATCSQLIDSLITENQLTDTMICTGPVTGGTGVCYGDSGSPVTQDGMVVGMASWTIMPCATERSPSVYTRVSAFLDFVNEHI